MLPDALCPQAGVLPDATLPDATLPDTLCPRAGALPDALCLYFYALGVFCLLCFFFSLKKMFV